MKWEYRSEGCDVGRYYDEFIELIAKRLGEEGWELIHITERKGPDPQYQETVHLKGYFRRSVRVDDPPLPPPEEYVKNGGTYVGGY